MLPTPKNYAIYPSVVPTQKPILMTVLAQEKAFLFANDAEIEITVIGADNDELDYKNPQTHKKLTATAHDGILQFVYTFESEQEYLIKLSRGSTLLSEHSVYSLEQDLYGTIPLKSDFHSHSFRSDGKRDPSASAGHYREQAYDCYALTDHNRFYPGGEIDETYRGVDMNFFRITGEEVHTPRSLIHIVHIGGKCSVAEQYVNDLDGYEQEVAQYRERIPENIPEKYADRYARAMWATDKIHAVDGLAIFPHPFWRPGGSQVNNVCIELAKLLIKSGMFDAYEVIGGMKQPENNLSVAFWNDLRAEGVSIPIVGSSDVHGFEKSVYFPHLYTVCFAKEQTPQAVLAAIKEGATVAVEACGTEYDLHYRCYGNLRYVSYAQFLLRNFFHEMERICTGEGVAMRAYAMGEAPKELVELQAKQSREFRARFFGRMDPVYPSAEMLDFEEKWREIQRRGPQTKGSSIITNTPSYQI